MNIRAMQWAARVRGLSIVEHDVLYRFAVYAGRNDDSCFPSIKTLAFEMETTRRYVERTIVKIEEKGFISREEQFDGRRRHVNRYRFNFGRNFPKGPGSDVGEKILDKIKLYFRGKLSDDAYEMGAAGWKHAYLDDQRRLLWIAVESETHATFLLRYLPQISSLILSTFGTTERKLPRNARRTSIVEAPFKIEILPLYSRKGD